MTTTEENFMPKYIVKIDKEEANSENDLYMYWSTVVDSPVSNLMPLPEFKEWYEWRYPQASPDEFSKRMERVEATGTSAESGISLEDLLIVNRAGEKESLLTKEELIVRYTKDS